MSSNNVSFRVVRASQDEASMLTEIAFRSKAHWGYPPHWLEIWREELEVTAESFEEEQVYKAINEQKEILGYYRLLGSGKKLTLNGFWVLTEFMGQGIGRALFEHMYTTAKNAGARSISWESDPNTLDFYMHMGAKQIDSRTYLFEGKKRTLPILEIDLN